VTMYASVSDAWLSMHWQGNSKGQKEASENRWSHLYAIHTKALEHKRK